MSEWEFLLSPLTVIPGHPLHKEGYQVIQAEVREKTQSSGQGSNDPIVYPRPPCRGRISSTGKVLMFVLIFASGRDLSQPALQKVER